MVSTLLGYMQRLIVIGKVVKSTLLVLILFFVLCGCGKLESGVVIDKKYTERKVYPVTEYNVALKMPMVRTQVIPESYELLIKGNYAGKNIEEWKIVTSTIYKKTNIGDDWTNK